MTAVNNLLLTTDWSNLNKTNVNIAFKEFQNMLDQCLDTITPIKQINIPRHKIWHEPWITKGLSRSMDKCMTIIYTV